MQFVQRCIMMNLIFGYSRGNCNNGGASCEGSGHSIGSLGRLQRRQQSAVCCRVLGFAQGQDRDRRNRKCGFGGYSLGWVRTCIVHGKYCNLYMGCPILNLFGTVSQFRIQHYSYGSIPCKNDEHLNIFSQIFEFIIFHSISLHPSSRPPPNESQ